MEKPESIRYQGGLRPYPAGVGSQRPAYQSEPRDSAGLLASWNLVLLHKTVVLVVTLASVAASVVFTKLQAPTFRVHTLIKVEPRNGYFLNLREIDPTVTGDTSNEAYLSTEAEVLQSESMIRKALMSVDRPVPAAAASFVPRAIQWFRPAADAPKPGIQETVREIGQNLSTSSVHEGQIIDLSFESTDRLFAVDFLNALSAAFVKDTSDLRHETSTFTQKRLNDQLAETRAKLEASESELQNYASTAGLLFTSDKSSVAEDQLRGLEQEFAAARADRILKQTQRDIAASRSPASLPSVLDNLTLRDYQAKLMELNRQRAELQAMFTDNHPEVKATQAQIEEVQSGLATLRNQVVERVVNDYQAATQREQMLAAAVGEQTKRVADDSANSVRYNVLQREVETNRAIYDTMLQRTSNSLLVSAMEVPDIRVIDPATLPSEAFKPRLGQNVMVSAIGGIVFGMLLVLVTEGKDRRIRSPLDLRSLIGVQQLGVVPFTAFKPTALRKTSGLLTGTGAAVQSSLYRSNNALADSFRATLTSVLSRDPNGTVPQTIVVTSPTTGDGKTTVVCNLGMALAEVKKRVLLIDADTRNPGLHGRFGIRNTIGLTDILRGDVEFSEGVLHRVQLNQADPSDPLRSVSTIDSTGHGRRGSSAVLPGLYVLTRGTDDENAISLLYSEQMEALARRLRADFDAIVIDTPPVVSLPHARVLGKHADGVVLVVRSGYTSAGLARESLMLLDGDSISILGTVLNAFDSRRSPYIYCSKGGESDRYPG
jgi:polysaccharide biosynthesis transport protein